MEKEILGLSQQDTFVQISRYRAELMGYAILGVFVCHVVMRTDISSFLIATIPRLVYTQGFLFLSGFGLYYSFSKDNSLSHFFKKRICRLFIPYVLISFPFFLIICLNEKQSILDLLGYLTTFAFWCKGNFYGMWYIAVTIAMYLLFPLMYRWIFNRVEGRIFRGVILLIVYLMLIILLKEELPNYYAKIGSWIKKTWMFPIGIICGYISKSEVKSRFTKYMVILPLIIFLFVVTKIRFYFFYEYARSFIGIFFLPILFSFNSNYIFLRTINNILSWLGKYSLELYILHVLIFKTIYYFKPNSMAVEMVVSILIALIICVPVHKQVNRIIAKL